MFKFSACAIKKNEMKLKPTFGIRMTLQLANLLLISAITRKVSVKLIERLIHLWVMEISMGKNFFPNMNRL